MGMGSWSLFFGEGIFLGTFFWDKYWVVIFLVRILFKFWESTRTHTHTLHEFSNQSVVFFLTAKKEMRNWTSIL